MRPIDFLKRYSYDKRLVTGDYYPDPPLYIQPGDRVGVVLLNLGGPRSADEVEPFLYNLFMDPAIIDIPLTPRLRDWVCRLVARRRSKGVAEEYGLIGGGSPINVLTEQQAKALDRQLNATLGPALGAHFYTYIAMRYWKPTTEETAARMAEDGINKVILLPLYPQYSKTTTGSSLHYWWLLEEVGEIKRLPTVAVKEYAAHPAYIAAINARIDEAILKFPEDVRDEVVILFSAHGTPVKEMKVRRDPYCCLIHTTVDRVMKQRRDNRPFHVAFQSKVGPAEWLTPSTPDKLKELGESGHSAVLVVPVAFVSDHVETAFELDIEVRHEAEGFGIHHYVVSGGLNDHPGFIEALVEATRAHLAARPPQETDEPAPEPLIWPRFKATDRKVACHQCLRITEACRWEPAS